MHFALSCDIVNSSSLSIESKDRLQDKILHYVEELLVGQKYYIEFYRGDAFQVLCSDEYYGLSTAIGIRAITKSLFAANKTIDVRVSLAVGTIDRWPTNKVQAEGAALILSG